MTLTATAAPSPNPGNWRRELPKLVRSHLFLAHVDDLVSPPRYLMAEAKRAIYGTADTLIADSPSLAFRQLLDASGADLDDLLTQESVYRVAEDTVDRFEEDRFTI